MSYASRETVSVTTAADGTATGYSSALTGKISTIFYVKPGSGSFSDGVDFTITAETTGQNIWTENNVNASTIRAPRQATHGVDGVASLYAAAGLAVQAPIALAGERIKFAIASGGDTKNGQFIVVME